MKSYAGIASFTSSSSIFLEGASMRRLGGFFGALAAASFVLHITASNALAIDTMADWVGRNNAPGPNYHFDEQVLNETNIAGNFPTSDNFVVISPTSIGGQKQAKVNFNQDPNRNINEEIDGVSAINHEHIYLADRELEEELDFTKPLHMEGTWTIDMPSMGAQEAGTEPNFCFCWYDPTDTRHRIGLGLSNTTETGFTAQPDKVRFDLFYASTAGNGFVFATKDGTQTNGENALVPDGTYRVVFDYVPGNDINSEDTTGSSMSATITDVTDETKVWSSTLSPLPNAPWFHDFFSLNKFGVIIRSTNGGVRNGVFNFTISDLDYTGGTELAAPSPDFNNDGIVDAADYVAYRKTDGSSLGFNAFKTHFGEPIPGGGTGVPEPNSIILCIFGAMALSFRVRNWRHR